MRKICNWSQDDAVENNLKIDYKCCTLDEYIKNSKKTVNL